MKHENCEISNNFIISSLLKCQDFLTQAFIFLIQMLVTSIGININLVHHAQLIGLILGLFFVTLNDIQN